MKRLKNILVRLSVFALCFIAGMMIAKAAKAQSNSLLWKIEGANLESPSYLMGTIHLLCEDELNLSITLNEALKNTEQLYLELDFDDPAVMQELQAGLMLKDGTKLNDLLTAEELKSLDQYLQTQLGASVESLSSVKPFFIMSMLYPQFLGCPTVSMEMELAGMAKSQGSEVFGLETVSEEMAALDAMPLDVQTDFLLESINSGNEELNTMRELYHSEDVEALYAFTSEGFDDYMDGYSEIILDQRNEEWISKMKSAMADKPTFFAVGAAHLAGNRGVIELLRAEGYTVEAVSQTYSAIEETTENASFNASPIIKSWKIAESQIESTLEMVINSILEKNPEAEAQVMAQKSAIESMVRNTVKEYKADGTYTITIPYTGTQTGQWELNENGDVLTETDQEGEVSTKTVKVLKADQLVLINEDGEEKIYQPSE